MAESAPASDGAASEHPPEPLPTDGEPTDPTDSMTAGRDEEAAALAELAARVDPVPEAVAESARRALERLRGTSESARPDA